MTPRYWIGVVSKSHVDRGVAGGFAQVCHGKAGPLKKMKANDYLIYYSPKTDMTDGEPLQCFTALGIVIDHEPYFYPMSEDFVPARRNIRYLDFKPVPIKPLIPQLKFILDPKHWGYAFRFGHFEITKEDFNLIVTTSNHQKTAETRIGHQTEVV